MIDPSCLEQTYDINQSQVVFEHVQNSDKIAGEAHAKKNHRTAVLNWSLDWCKTILS